MAANPEDINTEEPVHELDQVFIPSGRVLKHPRLHNLDEVRREFAKLYRELRAGRTGLKRAALMLQTLREIRETFAAQNPKPSHPTNVLVVAGEIPPGLQRVTEMFGTEPVSRPALAAPVQERPVPVADAWHEANGCGETVVVCQVPRDPDES